LGGLQYGGSLTSLATAQLWINEGRSAAS